MHSYLKSNIPILRSMSLFFFLFRSPTYSVSDMVTFRSHFLTPNGETRLFISINKVILWFHRWMNKPV